MNFRLFGTEFHSPIYSKDQVHYTFIRNCIIIYGHYLLNIVVLPHMTILFISIYFYGGAKHLLV